MANTKSARKATRVIARRTEVNKARRTLLRNSMRKVEEAIQSGDRNAALAAFKAAGAGYHARGATRRRTQEQRRPESFAPRPSHCQTRQVASATSARRDFCSEFMCRGVFR